MPAVPTLPELYDAHAAGLFHSFTGFTGNAAIAKDTAPVMLWDQRAAAIEALLVAH